MEGSRKKQGYFKRMVRQAANDVAALQPLAAFLADENQLETLRVRLIKEKARPTDWLRWSVAGVDPLKQSSVLDWWRVWREADHVKGKIILQPKRGRNRAESPSAKDLDGMVCFVTGAVSKPLLTHPRVSGLAGMGGLGTKTVMVGFDKSAFCSFGLDQAENASMAEKAARGYVDALDDLIKKRSRKMANALVVHWFKESITLEDDPLAYLFEPPEVTAAAAQSTARKILESLHTGQRALPSNNRYYAMTISGVSARIMVRDWMEGSFEELVRNVSAWFDDLEMTNRSGKHVVQDPKIEGVITSLLQLRKPKQKYEDWIKPIGHARIDLFRSAVQQGTIPFHVIARLATLLPAFFISDDLNRVLFGKQDDTENAGLYLSLLYKRMGLIKAYFIRKGGNNGMSTYLNKEHPEPAYHCGRLLAMLASLQQAALGDVGAGVVQRYYVAASQAPGLTLGRLVGNAKNHLNKLEGDRTYWFEGQIAEIWSRIKDYVPKTLDLEKQTLFALGYYQQIAANRPGKNKDTNDTNKGDK